MKNKILSQDTENMLEIMDKTVNRCDIWQDRFIYHIAKAIYHILIYINRKGELLMIDILKLEFVLKSHGISKQDLTEAQNWSSSTYYRKMQADSEWTVNEVNNLIALGVDIAEIIDIFF